MSSEIRDVSLWESGETKIQWVKGNMQSLYLASQDRRTESCCPAWAT